MAETKRKPAPVLASMTKEKFAVVLRDLKDLHQAADDAAMAVASGYKGLKKQGVNLDALKLARKLQALDNPAKIAAFLADFDRMRELAGFDDQLALFEDDKTKPQKTAEKVVDIKSSAKAKKAAKTAAKSPVSKGKLFDDGSGDAEVEEVSDEVKARQEGLTAGKSGEDYDNPYGEQGSLRDAFHQGWVEGSNSLESEPAEKATA